MVRSAGYSYHGGPRKPTGYSTGYDVPGLLQHEGAGLLIWSDWRLRVVLLGPLTLAHTLGGRRRAACSGFGYDRGVKMRCPRWLYEWIEERGRIPLVVRWIWRRAHWCDEMDGLLVVSNLEDCFCSLCADVRDERQGECNPPF